METVPKLSTLPGALIKAERVEVQICSPMYAKSMAKACSLLSSATEHVLYHCHYHLNVQVCSVPESIALGKFEFAILLCMYLTYVIIMCCC